MGSDGAPYFPPAAYAFWCILRLKIAPGGNIFFTNALKTAVWARNAGTTFQNLHQQKISGGFRISGGNFPRLYV